MKFTFEAKIYRVGINACVKVPSSITDKMKPLKGYIHVKGKIEAHKFTHTLVPVKNAGYRLYVNGPMLKGANVKVGEQVRFVIEQDLKSPAKKNLPVPAELKKQLDEHQLGSAFEELTASRQKDILKYLNYLKTEEALMRNVEKVISQLKKKKSNLRLP